MVCCRTEERLNNNNIIIIHIPVTKQQAKTDRRFVTGIIIINHTNFIVTIVNFIAHRQTFGRMDRAIFLVKHMLTITKGQKDTIENLFILLQFSLQRTDKTNFIMRQFSQKLTDVQIFLLNKFQRVTISLLKNVIMSPFSHQRTDVTIFLLNKCHHVTGSPQHIGVDRLISLPFAFHDDTFFIKKLPGLRLNRDRLFS